MSQEKKTIQSFTDLDTWKEAHKLVISVYKNTQHFPKEELFGLTNQLRRAAVSVSSNIAEGFSRSSNSDRAHFYTMSRGSLTELQNQFLIARDVMYMEEKPFKALAGQSVKVHKLLTGLLKATKRRDEKS